MLKIREIAEVYRLGLLIGYFKIDEFLKWVDSYIEKTEEPDIGFIEIAYSSSKGINEIVSAIDKLSENYDFHIPTKVILSLMYKDFQEGKINMEDLTYKLYSLSQYISDRNIEDSKLYELNTMDDYHHIYSENQIKQRLDSLLSVFGRIETEQYGN